MVAPGHQHPFAVTATPKADTRSGLLAPYSADNPASIELWEEQACAALDEAGVLESVLDPPLSIADWKAKHFGAEELKVRTATELRELYNTSYVQARELEKRKAYNILVRWPGVLSPAIQEAIKSRGLTRTRDGHDLWEILVKPADTSAHAVQTAMQAQIAVAHSLAYDPSSVLPFSSDDPPQSEVITFLETYWRAIYTTDAKGIDADPAVFVKTSLLVLRRISALKFTAEWLLQQYEGGMAMVRVQCRRRLRLRHIFPPR